MKKKILILAFWLLVWQLLSLLVHNPFLLVGPVGTVKALAGLIAQADFWISVCKSLFRIFGGLAAGSVLGILFAVLSHHFRLFRELAEPAVNVLKTVPVASFIIMILIWAGNGMVSFWISLLVVLPVLYFNTREGLSSVDQSMLEMAAVFRMSRFSNLRHIVLPELKPFILGAMQIAPAMAWKSGVAAEVIGQPLLSIGNGLYRSKINLDTGRLFAWTLVIVMISRAFEKLILMAVRKLMHD